MSEKKTFKVLPSEELVNDQPLISLQERRRLIALLKSIKIVEDKSSEIEVGEFVKFKP